jgi:hypothetical protein
LEKAVSEPKQLEKDPRIEREEEYWTTPRLFAVGLSFLGACIVVIYLMATYAFANTTG